MTRSLYTALRLVVLAAVALATLGLGAPTALAQHEEHGDAAAMPPMGRPAQMDKIAFMNGEWNVEFKFKMGPGTDWQVSEAQAVTKPVLNGCAQRMDFTGTVMGMAFHGFDITTYNRETKRFESVWLDDMGARMSTMYGDFNAEGNLVMEGETMESGMKMKTRSKNTVVDDDTVHWTMEMSLDGETWFDSMDMTYTRAD